VHARGNPARGAMCRRAGKNQASIAYKKSGLPATETDLWGLPVSAVAVTSSNQLDRPTYWTLSKACMLMGCTAAALSQSEAGVMRAW